MGTNDPRIDAYISKSADFARPILKHLRRLVHKACPGAEESMKWSHPHFGYKGAMMCAMASFKQHAAFGFWKASIMQDPHRIFGKSEMTAMGHLGRITSLSDLPSDKILIEYVREAARLNDDGVTVPKKARPLVKKPLRVPAYFKNALAANKKALAVFGDFSYSHKKEYIEWITEAKTDETRKKRLETSVKWISEGKGRNWKYMRK
jgi:uncharacterized protein YdeI (YjbR/CyaY-like superfamily)